MTQAALQPPGPARVREGRRVPARGLVHLHVLVAAGPRDARLPRARDPPARRGASPSSCSSRRCATAVADVSAPVDDELGGGRVRWGEQLDIRPLADRRAARRDRRLPGQVLDQEHRAGRRAAAPHRRRRRRHARRCASTSRTTCAPRSSSTPTPSAPRSSAPPQLGARRRPTSRPTGSPAALVIRVQRAIEHRRTAARAPARRHRAHRPRRVRLTTRPEARRHDARRRARRRRAACTWPTSPRSAPPTAAPRRDRPRSAAGRVRARLRLPRPLPDQEPPLLHDLQAAARRPRGLGARTDPRPLPRRHPTRARRGRGAHREARSRRHRPRNSFRHLLRARRARPSARTTPNRPRGARDQPRRRR